MKSFHKKNNFTLFFIIFLTSFLLGMIFTLEVGKKLNLGMFKTGTGASIVSFIEADENLDMTKFREIYYMIKQNNYDADTINNEDLVNSAIKGLVEGLGDKHSEYMTDDETKKFNEALSGDFEGIGAVVEKNPLGVVIDRVIKGSPAKKYGLLSGDILIKANGEELGELDLFDAVDFIKGPAGTPVLLEVLRKGESDILEIEVIREKIKIPSVDSEIFDEGNIGYISINMFGGDTAREFKKSLKTMENTDGLIIDLRDNGGGYLQSAVEILSELIPDGEVIVTTKYKSIFSNVEYRSINEGNIYNKKIVVLINENSASASEITAGALSDYEKAIVVGKKSYGKGSVQKPFDIKDGSMLKLTIAKWFTPNDRNIDKEGIEPDIEIDYEKEDFENKYDRQLEMAKEILKEYINLGALQLTIDKYNK